MIRDSQSLVIVTGGARGIGAAAVDALLDAGTPVVIFDIGEAAPRHGARARLSGRVASLFPTRRRWPTHG